MIKVEALFDLGGLNQMSGTALLSLNCKVMPVKGLCGRLGRFRIPTDLMRPIGKLDVIRSALASESRSGQVGLVDKLLVLR